MAAVKLNLIVLKTRQVEQVRTFYQVLGLDLTEEQHGKGPIHFAGRIGDVVIEIYPLPNDASLVDSSTRLGFDVENVAQVIMALDSIGTCIVSLPKDTPWGFQAIVKDPDGRSVELTQRQ
jgi:predicted enzyme related to lactoylglutathione lyase